MPRPVFTFRSFIGNKKLVDFLRRQLEGAKHRGEPFPTTLFSGPSGVGKTLLAESLAAEYGTTLTVVSGYATPAELAAYLVQQHACNFFFIDEAHQLTPKSQETLFPVIDVHRVPLREQCNGGKTVDYQEIPPLTVMLATDQPGKLLNALEKRIEIHVRLGFYNSREMRAIIDRLAAETNLLLTPQAANDLARISWGLPRKAKHHLLNLRRHYSNTKHSQLGVQEIREFLSDFGIDQRGLGKTERAYMRFLDQTDSASLESLASYLGYDKEYLSRQIEPLLMRAGLITISSGGRRLSEKGRNALPKRTKNLNRNRKP